MTKKDDAGNLLVIGLDPYDAMAGEPDFAATSWGVKWYDEDTQEFDLDNPLFAESMDAMGEFIRYRRSRPVRWSAPGRRPGRLGRRLQCRRARHDHRRLLASG